LAADQRLYAAEARRGVRDGLDKASGSRLQEEAFVNILTLFRRNDTMENSHEVKNAPQGKVTRRRFFQASVVGALTALTGLQIGYRMSKPKDKPGWTDITIEGPFKRYGSFKAEDLVKPEELKRSGITSDFKLREICFRERKYEDVVFIEFTFAGKEVPNRKMMVSLTIYDKEENVIGKARCPFEDPRIFARTENAKEGWFIIEPVVSLDACLVKGKDISHISRMEISVVEIKNQ
jgi:hypothetical protein